LVIGLSTLTGSAAFALSRAMDGKPSLTLPSIPLQSPLRAMLRSKNVKPHRVGHATLTSGRGDLSGDGRPDLVTVRTGTNALEVHTGAAGGIGAFTTATTIGTTASDRIWLGQGDLTGDGNPDIATLSSDGTMRIATHTGTFDGLHTLNAEFTWATGWQAGNLFTLTDFLGRDPNNPTELDGLADVLFRYSGDNGYYVYINEGANANGFPQLRNWGKLLNDMQAVISVSIADVTGDGFPDLYMTFTDGSARLLDLFAEQDSTGQWHEKWYTIQPTGADASDFRTLTDVNGDGLPDLVTRRKAAGELRVDFHSGLWNPATPSTLFDTTHEKVLATGWTSYRLAA
jgi:hypothetical protein